MPSRRQIREAVVQFLYCADLEGGPPAADLRESFWNLITESDRRKLLTHTFRALEHLNMGRAERIIDLTERSQLLLPRLSATTASMPLRADLEHILQKESAWSVCFDRLKKIPFTEVADDEVVPPLEALLTDLFALERDLAQLRKDFLFAIEDHPAIRNHAQPVTSLIRRMERISDRNLMLEHPEKFPEQTDLVHLRGAKETLTELRREADAMVDHVIQHKKRIDEVLASIIENFAPERIMPVDRAILRLCTAEFLQGSSATPKVEINEAIDIAKKYGSEDSGRFVNGVLDAVARKLHPHQFAT